MPKLVDRCLHCRQPIKKERVTLSYQRGDVAQTDLFCSSDCMTEYLWDEAIHERIDREVRKEINFLHKQICPSCRRRIT